MTGKYSLGNQDVDTSFITLEMSWKGMQDERIKDQLGLLHPTGFAEIIKGATINYHTEANKTSDFIELCAKSLLKNKPITFVSSNSFDSFPI